MVIFLAQIPYEEFKALPDKKTYALQCDFVSIKTRIKKRNLYEEVYAWAEWYNLFSATPLYLYIIKDKEWQITLENDGLKNSVRFTNWKTIPKNTFEAESYNMIPESERLWQSQNYLYNTCQDIIQSDMSNTKFIGRILKEK